MGVDIAARFHDGHTAAAHAVIVNADEGGLRVTGPGIDQHMPYADLVVADRRAAEIRLTSKSAPDLRLIGPTALIDLLATAAPQLVSRRTDLRKNAVAALVLTAASAALLAVLFIGVPMAAEPLAHATPERYEQTLGGNFAAQISSVMPTCAGPQADAAQAAIAPLLNEFAVHQKTDFPLIFEFVHESSPNAMALPGGRVIVTSGLLDTLEKPDELAAVIAHEIGHVEARDGLIALYRHMGVAVALDIIAGGGGLAQQVVLLSGQISEMRHSRAQETRADDVALRLMRDAGYDPAALGRAFARLEGWMDHEEESNKGKDKGPKLKTPEWFASHPDIRARREKAKAAAIPGRPQPLSAPDWETVRAACQGELGDD
jgi:beta-barrel assembly-enhancing protease